MKGTGFLTTHKLKASGCFLASFEAPLKVTVRGFDDDDDVILEPILHHLLVALTLFCEVDIIISGVQVRGSDRIQIQVHLPPQLPSDL